jgi:hypothetical protein
LVHALRCGIIAANSLHEREYTQMEYRKLGRSGLEVSQLALGTMQFGWTAGEDTSFAIMDAYQGAGGTLIDTSDIYTNWVEGNPGACPNGSSVAG